MTERRVDEQAIREMSDKDIKGIFDVFIEAWEDRTKVEQELVDFNRKYLLPEPPFALIENVEALMEYNRQKWRYEDRKRDIEARLLTHTKTFEDRSSVVQRLLPENHRVLHAYGGSQPELQGFMYEIKHKTRFVERGPRAVKTSDIRVQRR